MAAARKIFIFALVAMACAVVYCQTGDAEQLGCGAEGGGIQESESAPSAAEEYIQFITSGGKAQAGDDELQGCGSAGEGSDAESQSPLTAAEQYIQFITSGGKVPDDELEEEEAGEDMSKEVEYDWGSWVMSIIMEHFYRKFERVSKRKTKAKLKNVIKRMDANGDGKVTKEELLASLKKVAFKGAVLEAKKKGKMGPSDLNKDGKMSWDEVYEDLKAANRQTTVADFQRQVDLDKVKFRNADRNNDGFLDKKEYRYWLLPDYFEGMEEYQIAKHMHDFDINNDKTVSMEEYMQTFDGSKLSEAAVEDERKRFAALDTNHDGFMSSEELAPESLKYVISSVINDHAAKMIRKGDTDGDGVLTKKEILKNYQFFTKEIAAEAISDAQVVPSVTEQNPAHKHTEL